ncbi:MAG TPA: hypothetical protein GXZ48_02400 [Acholeplasmataceae bacterium]|nr:hypothetical protein [Acholeplasmataceae bacterium]
MKNIFGIKQGREIIDGHVFIVNKVNDEQEKKLEKISEDLDKQIEDSMSLLNIFYYISLIVGLLCLAGIIRSLFKVTFKEALRDAPVVFITGGFFLLVTLAIFIYKKIRSRMKEIGPEHEKFEHEILNAIEESKKLLNVPKDAEEIDVFVFHYKINKKGQVKIKTSPFFQYLITKAFLYIKNNDLCIANLYEEIKVPLSSIIGIKKINKKAFAYGWNKEEVYNSEKYKKYKIKENNLGTLFIKPYYSVLIDDPIGKYEFFVPCYDIDKVVKLTNLEVEDEI